MLGGVIVSLLAAIALLLAFGVAAGVIWMAWLAIIAWLDAGDPVFLIIALALGAAGVSIFAIAAQVARGWLAGITG